MNEFESLSKEFPASAEYLSSIYIIGRDYGDVTNSHLAKWMGVSNSAVSQALGRLKKLELVEQRAYGAMTLTEKGRELALIVLKRHYLIEHLLVRVLDFPWDKADEEAKILQNQISEDLAHHLDERLGHPQTCPHGNPIPGTAIEKKLLAAPILVDGPLNESLLILRITEEGEAVPEMLSFCQVHGIKPGTKLSITKKGPESLTIETEGRVFELSLSLARHIRFEQGSK